MGTLLAKLERSGDISLPMSGVEHEEGQDDRDKEEFGPGS